MASRPGVRQNRSVARSRWSLWSDDSFLSIGSKGSVLSIGSVGSILSLGSIGSAASAFSIGSVLSLGSVLAARSRGSVMSARTRDRVLDDEGSRPSTLSAGILLLLAAAWACERLPAMRSWRPRALATPSPRGLERSRRTV
jgi:hypothetical protein